MLVLKLSIKAIWVLIKYGFKHQENFIPVVKSLWHFNKKIRISVSAILLFEHEKRYILVQNHHRPEFYAPIGGVYKHTSDRPEILDKIEWNADYTTNEVKENDMKNDLRGVIYGKYFPNFIDWFTSRRGRENEQCLYREIREELLEGRVGKNHRDKTSNFKIDLIRTVIEGPNSVTDKSYHAQFRHFDIYRLDLTCDESKDIISTLQDRASKGDNSLILVTKEEINEGRTNCGDKAIAPHTKYLFSSKWHGNEPAKYQSMNRHQ
ncbi:hypothetical protein D210916BOD24_35290 [Alteromonas sp. D210916BOD_24]|uniref:SMODS-associated NUDIX domain-containing protein n=1 Tax=Alteromonas sp. D210916BOD_24 TaxID=3157618 RepID=UPI00399C71CD